MGYGVLISWDLPDTNSSYTQIKIYKSSTLTGTYTLLTTITNITTTFYWDITGTTASWYKVSFLATGPDPDVESDLYGPFKGIPSITSAMLVKEKAELTGDEALFDNGVMLRVILEATRELRKNYGNPSFSIDLGYNTGQDTQRYSIGERDAIINRVYTLDDDYDPPTRVELTDGTDFIYDPEFGEITLLTSQLKSSGEEKSVVVEYTPSIYRDLATVLAARNYLRRSYQRTGDKYQKNLLEVLDKELNEKAQAVANAHVARVAKISQIPDFKMNSEIAPN